MAHGKNSANKSNKFGRQWWGNNQLTSLSVLASEDTKDFRNLQIIQ